MAARFWNVPPYELEMREDCEYWVRIAIRDRAAENMAQVMMQEHAAQKQRVKTR
jgi:hypothetical protein